jgi:hypothetical protein
MVGSRAVEGGADRSRAPWAVRVDWNLINDRHCLRAEVLLSPILISIRESGDGMLRASVCHYEV